MWLAILVTVVASTLCSVGKALQKEGTRHLPRLTLERKIVKQYLQSPVWLTGLAGDLGGGVLQVFAFALAPVSVVQPVSGVGLVGLAIYSHFFLRERLRLLEWLAVALATLGTLGLGATSADEDSSSGSSSDSGSGSGSDPSSAAGPSAVRMVGVLAVLAGGVALVSLVRQRLRQRGGQARRGAGSSKSSAAIYGLQAGACFGLSAASCRTGFLLAARQRLWPVLGLAGSVSLSGWGFVLQTVGLKEGNTVVVCTCAAVSAMVSGVAVGLLALGESVASSWDGAALRVASWCAILVGVAALAGGAGGAAQLLAWALAQLPAATWKLLPLPVAVRLKSWAAEGARGKEGSVGGDSELPQHHVSAS